MMGMTSPVYLADLYVQLGYPWDLRKERNRMGQAKAELLEAYEKYPDLEDANVEDLTVARRDARVSLDVDRLKAIDIVLKHLGAV